MCMQSSRVCAVDRSSMLVIALCEDPTTFDHSQTQQTSPQELTHARVPNDMPHTQTHAYNHITSSLTLSPHVYVMCIISPRCVCHGEISRPEMDVEEQSRVIHTHTHNTRITSSHVYFLITVLFVSHRVSIRWWGKVWL